VRVLFFKHAFADEPNRTSQVFRTQIAPIILENCLACPRAEESRRRTALTTLPRELIQAGDSGELPDRGPLRTKEANSLRRPFVNESERDARLQRSTRARTGFGIDSAMGRGGRKPFDGEGRPRAVGARHSAHANTPPHRTSIRTRSDPAQRSFADGKSIVTSGYHELVIESPRWKLLPPHWQNVGPRKCFARGISHTRRTTH